MGNLHDAARAGDLDALRALIDAGAALDAAAEPRDPDPKGPPAETGAELVIRYGLLELIWPTLRGESTIKGRRKDRNGPTALTIAAAAGRSEVVDVLLDAGASPDLCDRDGFTALAYGAALGRTGFVRALETLRRAEPEPITGRTTNRDWINLRPDAPFPTGPTIGAEVIVPRKQADAMLAEHREEFLRRGAFLFRSRQFGDGYDFQSQRLGLLPTADKYTVIAAICSSGTD